MLKADDRSKRDCKGEGEVEVEVGGEQEQGEEAKRDVKQLEEGDQRIGSTFIQKAKRFAESAFQAQKDCRKSA